MPRAIDIAANPPLRLVVPDGAPSLEEARVRAAIAKETQRAAKAAYDVENDVRRVLALEAARSLEGGRAAILGPDQRRYLVQRGQKLGLRPFEANLVISVVQDGARQGRPLADPEVQRSIDVIPSPAKGDLWNDPWTWARLWLAAAALGGLLMVVLFEWFSAG